MVSYINTQCDLSHLDPDVNIPLQSNFQYYSVQDFHNNNLIRNCTTSANYFSAMHSNIRSLAANIDNFKEMLCELNHKFSVIALTETKIKVNKDNICNANIPGYTFISQPSLSNAGGTAFYVDETLQCNKRSDISKSTIDYESLWVEISSSMNHNLICGVIYRHPQSDLEAFMVFLNQTLNTISKENKYCLIMGDFNLNLLNYELHLGTDDFINTMGSYFFQPHILQPTRITNHSATLIDNIFFNSITHHTISGNITYELTDHLPNFIIINKFTTLPKNVVIYKRDFSNFNESLLIQDIQEIDWNYDNDACNCDVNSMFDEFHSKLSATIDKHAPLKQLGRRSIKNLSNPWVTLGIRNAIRVKNKLYKKYIKTRLLYYHSKFKMYRNKINHLIKINKISYYNRYFTLHKSSIKNIWKGIREIVNLKPMNFNLPSKLLKDGNEINNSKDIANVFNDFFTQVGHNLANSVPIANRPPMSYMQNRQSNSIYLSPTSSNEIENEIDKLKSSKATGPYSIPMTILKLLKTFISKPLECIFNCSLLTGVVPNKFKIASVIPIFKKASHMIVNNYRPISLLSIFNQLLEKIVSKRLTSFIINHNILYSKQFGFRSQHSTIQAVLSIIDKIQEGVENRKYSCGVFLDLSKAFDTVNHNILLQKLEHYGIRGVVLKWFQSYLEDRKQFVSIGNVRSDTSYISCGVPQGSVLGPLLFLLYINDIQKSSDLLDFHLFADDSSLFYSAKSLSELESIITCQLSHVHKWLCANKLSLNIEKSSFVIFHPTQKKLDYNVQIFLNDLSIKREYTIKYLGITIDCNLNWKSHVAEISKKIKRNIGVICKLRNFVNSHILKNLYYSLIYPYLIYGIVVWGNTYTSSTNPLFLLQKKLVRIIMFSDYLDHTNSIFLALNILKFQDLVFYHNALFMYDFHSGNLHAWHFCTRNCRFKMSRFFSQPCRIFWSLVTNLILEKFLKFIEKMLVRVFLYGDLRAIGRLRVSRGSK